MVFIVYKYVSLYSITACVDNASPLNNEQMFYLIKARSIKVLRSMTRYILMPINQLIVIIVNQKFYLV